MKDRGGRIKIPGFYDDVVPLQEEERKAWATLPFNEKQYKKDFGSRSSSARPLHDARADVGAADLRSATACCRASPARAPRPCCRPCDGKVSMRLVPNQTPDKIAELLRGARARAARRRPSS
jgi:hypothetical protein